jgi:preprotein translocase subunit SecY
MLKVLRDAWNIPDLRKKIFYTLILLVVFRIGTVIPVPYLSADIMKAFIDGSGGAGAMLSYLNMFSGGAFSSATIFAMSITPYINASIIIQLLTVAVPALERMQKDGEIGRQKLGMITRYVAVLLGLIQATGLYFSLLNSGYITGGGMLQYLMISLTFTAGTAFLMWLGEQITEKGIGNGISLLIFAGIVSSGPSMIVNAQSMMQSGILNWIGLTIVVVVAVLMTGIVVLMNSSERRLQVQYAKRVVGRKMYGGQSTHIPLKILSAGVMPIIFAMSIMAFPATIAQFFGVTSATESWVGSLLKFISQDGIPYAIIYFLLIIGFTYFYTSIQFNPAELANNMKKSSGFLPGIRPGKPTADYIKKVLSKITLAGAIFLAFLAVFPIFMTQISPGLSSFAIGGTSLLIVVGVALETTKQLEDNMMMRNYKGFLE